MVSHKDEKRNSVVEAWCNEWEKNGYVAQYGIRNRYVWFRTPFIRKNFSLTNEEDGPCAYIVEHFPLPSRLFLQFHATKLNTGDEAIFKHLQSSYSKKHLKNDWEFHRLMSWKINEYNSGDSSSFFGVADELKVELDKLVTIVIPRFEKGLMASIDNM